MTDEMVDDSVKTKVSDNTTESTESKTLTQDTKVDETKSEERSFNQYQVNDIVKEAKREAVERVKREYETQQANQQASSQIPAQNVSDQQNGGNISDDRLRSLISQESERMSLQQEAIRIANEFTNKLVAAKGKYPDLEEKVNSLNLTQVPQIAQWANSLDNTADVIYDIASNPSKFANILTLAHTAPHLAMTELNKLSSSIKKNDAASQEKSPPAPLGQIKPTTTGTDNGVMSIRDLKNQEWLKA